MAARYPVGRSSFSDGSSTSPYGKVQNVSTSIVARQVASLCYEFDTQYPGALARGDRLTVNEAIREDSRAVQLYVDYRRDPAHHPLAAFATWGPPKVITTTHRATIGTALDLGITQADGTNRAMTADEAAWVDRMGPRRGIYPTGNSFARPERWHKNGGYAYSVAPIVGVNQPGAKLYTAPKPTPAPAPQHRNEYDMHVQWNNTKTAADIIAGSDVTTIDKTTAKIGKLDWRAQIKLCERVERTDPKADYPGGLNATEQHAVRTILGRARAASDAAIVEAILKALGKA